MSKDVVSDLCSLLIMGGGDNADMATKEWLQFSLFKGNSNLRGLGKILFFVLFCFVFRVCVCLTQVTY